MSEQQNVVQAEFFLESSSEITEIKRVVRFFDQDHRLTLLALKVEMIEAKKRFYLHRLYRAVDSGRYLWFEKKRASFICKYLDSKLHRLKERMHFLMFEILKDVVERGALAIEREDRTFRPVLNKELGSLFETLLCKSRGLWLFVFSHTELCADKKVVMIAKIM
jgi:hypothetical protein